MDGCRTTKAASQLVVAVAAAASIGAGAALASCRLEPSCCELSWRLKWAACVWLPEGGPVGRAPERPPAATLASSSQRRWRVSASHSLLGRREQLAPQQHRPPARSLAELQKQQQHSHTFQTSKIN